MFLPHHHHTVSYRSTLNLQVSWLHCRRPGFCSTHNFCSKKLLLQVNFRTQMWLPQHILWVFFFWKKTMIQIPKQHLKNWNWKMFHSSLDSSCIQLTELTVRQSLFYNNHLKPKQTTLKPQSTNNHRISQINCLGFQTWSLWYPKSQLRDVSKKDSGY